MTGTIEFSTQADVSFPPPLRWHHLSGGAALLTGSNNMALVVVPGGDGMRAFRLPRGSVLSLFSDYPGIRVLGRTIYDDAEDMKDLVSDHFVLSACTANHKCLAMDQHRYWSGVSTVCHADGKSSEGVIASRVASQVRSCLRRLERLSIAYRTVLSIIDTSVSESSKTITNNKYAQHIGAEFRSLLNELYALRDAVIAATDLVVYGRRDGFSMNAFRKAVSEDQSELGRLIWRSMFDADGDRQVYLMSLHRAVSLHCLGRSNPIYGDGYQLRIGNGRLGRIPYLVFPLYDDVGHMTEIEKGSSRGILREITREQAERFMRKDDHIDALEFCFDCFERLLRIAERLGQQSDLASRPMVITDDDILSATFTDADGTVTRLRRDQTGKLIEC